jgi:hypothetical protein
MHNRRARRDCKTAAHHSRLSMSIFILQFAFFIFH